jgi:hypothetical protein
MPMKPNSRRKWFFASTSLGVLSILVLLARTATDPDARVRTAVMLIALAAFCTLIVLEVRKGRRH